MSFKKGNLYTNEAKTEGIYPNTVYSAIYKDDMSKTLDADLGDLSHYNAQTIISGVDPLYLHLDMDLLWENASPTSSFSAQTVSVDLSGYSSVLIVFRQMTSSNGCKTSITRKDGLSDIAQICDGLIRIRWYTLGTNSIAFDSGRQCNSYGSSFSVNDGVMIPQKIYGIR